MAAAPRFDPQRVAHYEKAGWEAYYQRNWPRVFGLMVALNREQFNMPPLKALAAAIDIVLASVAFAPAENDVAAATRHLQRYYEKARRSAHIEAAADDLARLEMDYWVMHRALALERQRRPGLDNLAPLVAVLAHLHASLFGISPTAARESAVFRSLAAQAVDRITGGYSTDEQADWRAVESCLQQAYRAVQSTGAARGTPI